MTAMEAAKEEGHNNDEQIEEEEHAGMKEKEVGSQEMSKRDLQMMNTNPDERSTMDIHLVQQVRFCTCYMPF